MTAEVPDMPDSQFCRPSVRARSGDPNTINAPPATSEAMSGMMTTGMSPRSQRGASKLAIQ